MSLNIPGNTVAITSFVTIVFFVPKLGNASFASEIGGEERFRNNVFGGLSFDQVGKYSNHNVYLRINGTVLKRNLY